MSKVSYGSKGESCQGVSKASRNAARACCRLTATMVGPPSMILKFVKNFINASMRLPQIMMCVKLTMSART